MDNVKVHFAEDIKEETLFSIETKGGTWYIDYDRDDDCYKVSKDEKFKVTKGSLGEALAHVFETFGSTRLLLL